MPVAKVDEINVSYKVSGDGQPLILITGFGGIPNALFAMVHTFGKHYRVVTFDNRGSGGSDKPTGLYSVRTMTGDTIGLMDFLGIEKAHLIVIGMSMGGMIHRRWLLITHREWTSWFYAVRARVVSRLRNCGLT